MRNSTQVITGPTLRQFANVAENGELIVTSKLGTHTLSRLRITSAEYEAAGEGRVAYLRDRVVSEYPFAVSTLGAMLEQCIQDQSKAVDTLLGKE